MLITPENVGDVIRMDHRPGYIRIEAVDDVMIQYCQENGHHYASYDHEIAGNIVRDKGRIEEFHKNMILGIALNNAEERAFRCVLDSNSSPADVTDAVSIIDSVKKMKERLVERIAKREARETGGLVQTRRLDDIISQANAEVRAHQHSHMPGLYLGADR